VHLNSGVYPSRHAARLSSPPIPSRDGISGQPLTRLRNILTIELQFYRNVATCENLTQTRFKTITPTAVTTLRRSSTATGTNFSEMRMSRTRSANLGSCCGVQRICIYRSSRRWSYSNSDNGRNSETFRAVLGFNWNGTLKPQSANLILSLKKPANSCPTASFLGKIRNFIRRFVR